LAGLYVEVLLKFLYLGHFLVRLPLVVNDLFENSWNQISYTHVNVCCRRRVWRKMS